ncbi:hypothetical protein ACQKCU_25050 [Heyndrickxia sporothermodurans]
MLYFLIFLLILLIVGMIILKKNKNKAKEYGAKEHYVAVHFYGIPYVSNSAFSTIFITEEKMIVECEKKKFELNLNRITAAEAVRETDLIQEDKSVIGRAVIGDLVSGPLGAIIGGMSGIGKKNKTGALLIINYISSENGAINVIIFDMKKFANAKKIATALTSDIIKKKTVNGVIEL